MQDNNRLEVGGTFYTLTGVGGRKNIHLLHV